MTRRHSRSPFCGPLARAHRHAYLMINQIAHNFTDRLEAIEQIEYKTDRRLRLPVGIKRHLARGMTHVAHRHGLTQFAPSRLGFAARQHPRLQDMQFGFRHCSLQPQQQAIVVVGRIIHPIGVGDQRIEQRADLQQLMPVPARARQPRHLDAQHEADIAQAHFGDQPLKAQTSLDARAGAPEIVVDHHDLFPPPAVLRGAIGEPVLQPGRLLMALNLLNRRLADVDDRQTVLVASQDLVADRGRCGAGQGSPPSSGVSSAISALRIRCRAICPNSVAMRPRRSRGSLFQIDAGRSLMAGSKPTRQCAKRLKPEFSAIRRLPSNYER